MSWRDNLTKVEINGRRMIAGSFRGAVFFVEDHTQTGGRRIVRDELPFADDPYIEDLGRKARDFNVRAYVLGDNYVALRDALLAALEAPGPGRLVHPYRGVRTCACDAYTLNETRDDGGLASFDIAFAEAPLQVASPDAQVDDIADVKDAAAAARTAAKANLVEVYDVTNAPAFSLTSIENSLKDAGRALDKAYAPIINTADDVAGFRRQVNRITEQAATILFSPVAVFDELQAAFNVVIRPPSIPTALADLLSRFSRRTVDSPASTPVRLQEKINLDAVQATQRRQALISMCETAVSGTVVYPSDVETEAARIDLSEKLSEEADAAEDDEVSNTLQRLRVSVFRALPRLARARRVLVTLPSTVPSLVVAHRAYGSTDREGEFVTRNKIPQPGFVLGGVTYELLRPVR